MTCIAAWIQDGTVWIGSETARGQGGEIIVSPTPKVWCREKEDITWVFGFAGMGRVRQICELEIDLPDECPPGNPLQFLVTQFIPRLRESLKKGGGLKIDNQIESMDGVLLIGLRGELFEVDSVFNVLQFGEPFTAEGSGEKVARGVLALAEKEKDKLGLSPEECIIYAITIATRYTGDCGGEITIVHT